ncbi:hypothetical protein HUJ04_012584 [Dendroctonus ponderosae]|nr:hypothetical protein HUJ04_012584 [Dendroctonus ponderosae]KAH1029815.1 hypothetical protein HUJ05_002976 [Dendroctonus ponderosae]
MTLHLRSRGGPLTNFCSTKVIIEKSVHFEMVDLRRAGVGFVKYPVGSMIYSKGTTTLTHANED